MPVDAPATNALLEHLKPLTTLAFEGVIDEVKAGQVLLSARAAEVEVYFPNTAVLSLISTMGSGDSCEVALVGREGIVGLAGVLASYDSTTSCVVQISGTCLRVPAASVRAARHNNVLVREHLDRYTTARLIQVAQVAACNRLHPIGSRLARWLLMLHDRVDGDYLRLSQQAIASSLGVHRPTIALELQRLDVSGAIVYRNRAVKVVDRVRLESLACECHEALHREYERLFTPVAGAALVSARDDSGAAAIEALQAIAAQLLMASVHERVARERAEAADRAKGQFLEMVSHELRTPLQAVLGWCELAKMPTPPPGAVEVIERNARAQLGVIDDLLDAARINAGALRISTREVSAARVVESAITTVRPVAEAKRISMRLTIGDAPTQVLADSGRLRQVITSVLMNAVKFSPEGSSVEIEVSTREELIEVRVIDRGIGISTERLSHVFERLSQEPGPSHERYQGLGLGLHIARTLIELHGGTIVLHSDGEGRGSTCRITLPRLGSPADISDGGTAATMMQ